MPSGCAPACPGSQPATPDNLATPTAACLQTQSLPALCECLRKAALDPRIKGVVVKIDPLAAGWGKLQVSWGWLGGWVGGWAWGVVAAGAGWAARGGWGAWLTTAGPCCTAVPTLLYGPGPSLTCRPCRRPGRRSCAGTWSTSGAAASLRWRTWSGLGRRSSTWPAPLARSTRRPPPASRCAACRWRAPSCAARWRR